MRVEDSDGDHHRWLETGFDVAKSDLATDSVEQRGNGSLPQAPVTIHRLGATAEPIVIAKSLPPVTLPSVPARGRAPPLSIHSI